MKETSKTAHSSADTVFDRLFTEILSLELKPLSTLTETDVAARFGVSRQPVRDAFSRLGSLGLLKIRPQRSTVVRGFSMERIQDARFVRLAIELEVFKSACVQWDEAAAADLDANLTLQRAAIAEGRIQEFHDLDYGFHRAICVHAGHPFAFETIQKCKQQVDRLCVLSLARDQELGEVMEDHEDIARALRGRSLKAATRLLRKHAGRLDEAIREIHVSHADYFE